MDEEEELHCLTQVLMSMIVNFILHLFY